MERVLIIEEFHDWKFHSQVAQMWLIVNFFDSKSGTHKRESGKITDTTGRFYVMKSRTNEMLATDEEPICNWDRKETANSASVTHIRDTTEQDVVSPPKRTLIISNNEFLNHIKIAKIASISCQNQRAAMQIFSLLHKIPRRDRWRESNASTLRGVFLVFGGYFVSIRRCDK